MSLPPLPIDAVLPEVLAALRATGTAVLRAPTGAGKTTRVPPAILDSGLARRQIVVLQPRRLAARATARRMASERGLRLGDEVGYHVRFDRRAGPRTRLLVVTEGILLRMLQDDPFLETVDAVVFDEFHERNLQSDLALAMVRRVRQSARRDLKIAVMSATLEGEPIARYLGDAPRIESQGRLFPVEISYREDLSNRGPAEYTCDGIGWMLDQVAGDVLAFLPGVGEIRQAARRLESLATERELAVLPLYGDLTPEQQDAVLAPSRRRKVVLATNVAETSITIDGIGGVVDSGLARTLVHDAEVGMDRLTLRPISQAAADQRAGRAGRTGPGHCLRLWPQRTHPARPVAEEPEIRRLDLAGPVLQLLAWGESDPENFPWFEPPPAGAIDQALGLLERLEAVESKRITAIGQTMARLPVHPRLARMLVEGSRMGQAPAVALAAAVLGEREVLSGERDDRGRRREPPPSDSDILDRVAALETFAQSGRLDTPLGRLDRPAAEHALRVCEQLLRELGARDRPEAVGAEEAVLRAVLAAFPDRLARRTSPGSRYGRMVGGRGVRLAESSAVRGAPLFLAVECDRGSSEALVWKASAVERSWLPAERLAVRTDVEFDPATERVAARRRVYWDDLPLEESPAPLPEEEAARVLAAAAVEHLDRVFPWDDPPTSDYLNRVRSLAIWLPELEFPAMDDAALRSILPDVARGCRSFTELRAAPWLAHLKNLLAPQQLREVDREAPERIEVPSGNRIRLRYEPGKPPVLAVRIQEIFGLLQTPRIARGRVAVLLHLLGPNMRPQQVTDDLESFWKNTYPQVRKDLRRRYPKHAWPEDPYRAVAEKRPKRLN